MNSVSVQHQTWTCYIRHSKISSNQTDNLNSYLQQEQKEHVEKCKKTCLDLGSRPRRQPKFSLLINPKSTMKHWTQTNEVEGVAENQHHHEPYPPPGPRNIVRCSHHHSNPWYPQRTSHSILSMTGIEPVPVAQLMGHRATVPKWMWHSHIKCWYM